jgi:hypothetical protein
MVCHFACTRAKPGPSARLVKQLLPATHFGNRHRENSGLITHTPTLTRDVAYTNLTIVGVSGPDRWSCHAMQAGSIMGWCAVWPQPDYLCTDACLTGRTQDMADAALHGEKCARASITEAQPHFKVISSRNRIMHDKREQSPIELGTPKQCLSPTAAAVSWCVIHSYPQHWPPANNMLGAGVLSMHIITIVQHTECRWGQLQLHKTRPWPEKLGQRLDSSKHQQPACLMHRVHACVCEWCTA